MGPWLTRQYTQAARVRDPARAFRLSKRAFAALTTKYGALQEGIDAQAQATAGRVQGLHVASVLVYALLVPGQHVEVAGQDLKYHHQHLQEPESPEKSWMVRIWENPHPANV